MATPESKPRSVTTPNPDIKLDLRKSFVPLSELYFRDSAGIFEIPFRSVIANVGKIISDNQNKDSKSGDPSKDKKGGTLPYSNIISIIGKRGSGKTSLLASVAKYLELPQDKRKTGRDKNTGEDLLQFTDEKELVINDCTFCVLSIVDPGSFKSGDTGFEAVLGEMYTLTRDEIDKAVNPSTAELFAQKSLIKSFERVTRALKYSRMSTEDVLWKDNNYSIESLERLENLAAGPQLREEFSKLVTKFLQFHTTTKAKKEEADCACTNSTYLIIPLDDIDLFNGDVMKLLEDLAVPLAVPRVIITGVRIKQLFAHLEVHYDRVFTKTSRPVLTTERKQLKEWQQIRESQQKAFFEEPRKLANRFLYKLFPVGFRVNLPDLSSPGVFTDKKVILKLGDGKDKNGKDGFREYNDISNAIFDLTFQKTGIRFVKELYGFHPLLPKTLREMHQYIQFLEKMKDIYKEEAVTLNSKEVKEGSSESEEIKEGSPESEKAKDTSESSKAEIRFRYKPIPSDGRATIVTDNLNSFREYILNQYAFERLDTSFEELIQQWIMTEHDKKNEFIIRNTLELFGGELKVKGDIKFSNHITDPNQGAITFDFNQMFNDIGNILQTFGLGDVLCVLRMVQESRSHDSRWVNYCFVIRALYAVEMTLIYETASSEDKTTTKEDYSWAKEMLKYLGNMIYTPYVLKITPDDSEFLMSRHFFRMDCPDLSNKDNQKLELTVARLMLCFMSQRGDFKPEIYHKCKDSIYNHFSKSANNNRQTFNILHLQTNLLQPMLLLNKLFQNVNVELRGEFCLEIQKWVGEKKLLFPIHNPELLEHILFFLTKEMLEDQLEIENGEPTVDFSWLPQFFHLLNKKLEGTVLMDSLDDLRYFRAFEFAILDSTEKNNKEVSVKEQETVAYFLQLPDILLSNSSQPVEKPSQEKGHGTLNDGGSN